MRQSEYFFFLFFYLLIDGKSNGANAAVMEGVILLCSIDVETLHFSLLLMSSLSLVWQLSAQQILIPTTA